jgi:hypothetical protein
MMRFDLNGARTFVLYLLAAISLPCYIPNTWLFWSSLEQGRRLIVRMSWLWLCYSPPLYPHSRASIVGSICSTVL